YDSRGAHDPGAGRPAQDAGGRLVRVRGAPARPDENGHREHTQSRVDDAARECRNPIETAVRPFWAVTDSCANESPESVGAEADREQRQQVRAERLVRNGRERAPLIRDLAP